MNKQDWIYVIIAMVLVSVIVSFASLKMTGNVVRVPTSIATSQTDVYTTAEVNSRLAEVRSQIERLPEMTIIKLNNTRSDVGINKVDMFQYRNGSWNNVVLGAQRGSIVDLGEVRIGFGSINPGNRTVLLIPTMNMNNHTAYLGDLGCDYDVCLYSIDQVDRGKGYIVVTDINIRS
jgi:hypothetical protein